MQLTMNWEKNSTVRNRPKRILINDASKYFFPVSEQPMCFHPRVAALGEEAKHSILIQSAYIFMQNIFVNETEVVCKIARKIIEEKLNLHLPEDMYQNLLTVIIDETYHAYVANDFIHQVANVTKIKPIRFSEDSSLTRAINLTLNTLPKQYHIFFEIIAVCIAENSITKELIGTIKDSEVNSFFNEVNTDHLADEGRHCGIFSELLMCLWQGMTDDLKKTIGLCLPNFICEYLSRDVKIKNDRAILSWLELIDDDIETILYDTHPDYTIETLCLINPVTNNIMSALKKAGVLSHPDTAKAFEKLGYNENTNFPQNTKIQQTQKQWQFLLENINSWKINFLHPVEHSIFPEQQLHRSILLNVNIQDTICFGFIMSYLHDVTGHSKLCFSLKVNSSRKNTISVPVISSLLNMKSISDFTSQIDKNIADSIALASSFDETDESEFLKEDSNWRHKIPLSITFSENFVLENNFPEFLQIYIYPNARNILQINIYYNSNYYDSTRIEEFLENVSYYIIKGFNIPSCLRKDLPLVAPEQKELLLKHAKNCSVNENINETILTLFAKQVANNPMHISVASDSTTINYKELDQLSNNVAHKLEISGLKRGSIIAVIHEHTYTYIPIILGIMKAKMVFLPLSPNETTARLHAILQEAEVALVISDIKDIPSIYTEFSWAFSLDLTHNNENKIKIDIHKSKLTQEELAYIIYTSGSSGMPKGVMITHQSLINFTKSAAKTFPITNHDRVLQFCSYNFDASLADICASLISGASIFLRSKNMLDSTSCFFKFCHLNKITLLNLPATLWGQLTQDMLEFSLELPHSLKTVVIGGEAVAPAILEQWFQHKTSKIRLLNTYGPTEATIAVTACELNAYVGFNSREKLIGQSFTHASLYVLDDYLRFLPIGASGELYIGGPGVSQGYLKRDDLTLKNFFNNLNQFNSDIPNSGSVYQTGDKVRWINKETLEFIGRNDRQIKFRGFRIELGEIEYVFNKHPLVLSSSVIYHDEAFIPYIVAFIIPEYSDKTKEVNDIISSLKTYSKLNLPEHMQPAKIELIEKWPLTIQGKIDKNKLISLLLIESKNQHSTNNINSKLELLWVSLLGVKDINSDSHFFYLGGHSLLAMRLLALINREFKTQLTVREILENPKFNCMVTTIKQSIGKNNSNTQIQLGSVSGPLSYSQEGLFINDYLQNKKSINYNISFALHLKGLIYPDVLEKSVNYIIERQMILRSILKKDESFIQTVVQMNVYLKTEVVTLDQFKEQALSDARMPFDISTHPPLRIRLFQIDSTYFILFVNHHHIIHDASSIDIFVKELSIVYESFCENNLPQLPKLHCQYVDYSKWQRSIENECTKNSLDYWCQQLENYKPLCLPFRIPNAGMNYSSGHIYYFTIDHSTTQELRNICNNRDCTLFVGLQTILTLLLHRYSGENDIAFASVMSTRDHQIDEHLMGMFINVVILRNRVSPENSFFDLLAPVKKTLFDATSHSFTPLEHINKCINLQRLPFCHTLVDVCLNYQYFDHNFAKFASKTIHSEIEFIDNKTAKFGLSFDIYDNQKSLLIKIEYCTELYKRCSIEKFANDFITLTKSVVGV